MGDFISWTEKKYIDTKTGKEKTAVLFLTDYEVFDTKKGEELRKRCGNNDDLVGHGAIAYYFDMDIHSFPHYENTNMRNPSTIPAEIIRAVKEGKLNKLMRYAQHCQLFEMIKPEIVAKTTMGKTDYDSLIFCDDVPEKERKEITEGIERMKKDPRCQYTPTSIWTHKREIGNILARLRWTNSKEGFEYWNRIACYSIVNTFSGTGIDFAQFMKLWRVNENRIEFWQLKEKKKRTRKTAV